MMSFTTVSLHVFLLTLCFVLESQCLDPSIDVEIESGPVRGYLAEDGDYYAFLGIPYASPPIQKRRFKAPFPAPYWNTTFHANRIVKCPQRGQGEEDCLVLNVFRPTKIIHGPLPVLVYIHGGSFLIKSGQTKGMEPLMRQNVIVVTLNYRLGALGFLCLGTEDAPGNAGLKDQIQALKWVRGNIDYFGGDPKKVTIYGMSAGGASVELLLLSESAKYLFHKAIIESGTATAVWAVDAHPIETALNLARGFVFPNKTSDISRLADYYKGVPAEVLSTVNFEYYQNLTDGTFGFVPCVEKKVFRSAPFITTAPIDLIKKGKYTKVPMLFIFGSSEGLYLRSSDYNELNYKEKMAVKFGDFIPADLIFDTEEIKDEVTENVRRFYFGNKTIGDDTLAEYLDYFGDHLVMQGLLNSVVAYSKNNTVYLMEFAYKGNLGSSDDYFDFLNVAGHGDAAKYVILDKTIQDKHDKLIVDRMVRIVANFMKYSNPIPNKTEMLPIHWPTIDPDKVQYLRMNRTLQVYEEPFWERKRIWDVLYETYRRNIKPVGSL